MATLLMQGATKRIEDARKRLLPSLDLSKCALETLPDLTDLKSVKALDISFNKIYRLTDGVTSQSLLPPNLEVLNGRSNRITRVEKDDLPSCVKKVNLSSNRISVFESQPESLVELDLENNPLKELDTTHCDELTDLNIANCMIEDITYTSDAVLRMDAQNNRIESVEVWSNALEEIDLSYNPLETVGNIPGDCRKFACVMCSISEITLPSTMTHFNASGNVFEIMPEINDGMLDVDLSHNSIEKVEDGDFPSSLRNADLSHNNIDVDPKIRKTLTVDLSGNPFENEEDDDADDYYSTPAVTYHNGVKTTTYGGGHSYGYSGHTSSYQSSYRHTNYDSRSGTNAHYVTYQRETSKVWS